MAHRGGAGPQLGTAGAALGPGTLGLHAGRVGHTATTPAVGRELDGRGQAIVDGYDVGVRYADDALGALMNKLDDLGVLDETAVLVSSDHGEAFGELGVYADHQAADEATCHIPAVLRWPGIEPRVHEGLQYHLDVAATVVALAGFRVPRQWDGVPIDIGGLGPRASRAVTRSVVVPTRRAVR